MCRLFGLISKAPAGARDYLVDCEFSLLKQSNFKKGNLQADGWGIASFGNKGRLLVSKSPKPAFREKEAFLRAAAQARSRVVIGHIRAASNPRGLPKSRLINMANTQPFTDGRRWLFAHNGTLQIPEEVSRRLGPWRRRLKSLNDSEVYFWHFLKHYHKVRHVPRALQACVQEIWEIWAGCLESHPGKTAPYTSLNALISDGESLHALCHATGKGLSKHGVCNLDQPWSLMSWSRRGQALIVASENLDRGPWTRFEPPEVLSAEIKGGRLKMTRTPIDAPQLPL